MYKYLKIIDEPTAPKFPPPRNYYFELFIVYSRYFCMYIYIFKRYYWPCIMGIFQLLYFLE